MSNLYPKELLAEKAQILVSSANIYAVSSFSSMLDIFPILKNIKIEDWDFFVTVACVFIAATRLRKIDIDFKFEEKLMGRVAEDLNNWNGNGVLAFEDCKAFFEKNHIKAPSIVQRYKKEDSFLDADILGMWIVWNTTREMPKEKGMKFARYLGGLIIHTFYEWWSGD